MMHGDYEKRRYRKITIWSCKSLKFIELLLGELQIQLCINYGFWKANKRLFKIDALVDKFGWFQFLCEVKYSSISYQRNISVHVCNLNFSLIALMYKWLECNRILKSVAIVMLCLQGTAFTYQQELRLIAYFILKWSKARISSVFEWMHTLFYYC